MTVTGGLPGPLPSVPSRYIKFWCFFVLGAPVWWCLGLNLGIYHGMAVLWLVVMLFDFTRRGRGLYVPTSAFFIFLISVTYLFSLALNGPAADPVRFAASTYNFCFWIMGLCVVLVFANVFTSADARNFLRPFWGLSLMIAGCSVVMYLLYRQGFHSVSFPSPFYGLTSFLGHTPLIENSLAVNILMWDWFISGMAPRFNFLSPYTVATAGVILQALVMLTVYRKIEGPKSTPFFYGLWLLTFFAMVMTLSRMPVISFLAAYVFVFLVRKKKALLWILVFGFVLVAAYPWIDRLLRFFLSMREGSNASRIELYLYSLKQLEGVEWILGLGVKPREDSFFSVPLGSHSTYLSILFRMGGVGLGCFIIMQACLLWEWHSLKALVGDDRIRFPLWQGFGWVFIAMLMCWLTDEVDTAQVQAFLYFSVLGAFEGLRREILFGEQT